ncbi:MAG: signal peptidase I [Candidatus Parcubacteria bacterium]|nr:signal peptidase I [Candidatus Parcubacteria bacterium]
MNKNNDQDEQFEWNTKSSYDSLLKTVGEFFVEIVKVVIISLAIIIPVRYFLIQPFYVKGASMEPNFYDHEYLIINEISYRFTGPERGDIIIFRYPKDPSQYFIKRVIGLPGDIIKLKDNKIYIKTKETSDFVALDETEYLNEDVNTLSFGRSDYELEADQFFVMGDNREQSLDSRRFGPIDRRLIIGKAWIRGWPFDKVTIFKTPQFNF